VALQGNLKKEGFFNGKEEPNLMGFLDIVALGTVCDVVPLLGLNRAFVKQGLKIMKEKPSIGIKALANVANLDLEQVSCYSLGFVLGPRINAGGRVGEASLGAEILSSESETRAMEIALKLEQYNAERKAIEATILEETYEKIEAERLYENSVIIVSGDNWHVGVIGILASRVKEKYNRPTAVISFDENGVGKASARSINGVDFGGMVIRAKDQELLVNGGGHKMAAGFTIVKSNLAEFSDFLNDNLKDQVGDALKNQVISYDKEFSVSALNVDLCKDLEILAPFGVANSEPRFVLKNCKIVHFNIMKEKHLKLVLAEESSGLYGKNIEAVIWQAADKGFIEEVAKNPKAKFSFLGKIRINNWNNQEKVQFEVEDLRVC
jgi:single-stranded-DNA-specific exonuclease